MEAAKSKAADEKEGHPQTPKAPNPQLQWAWAKQMKKGSGTLVFLADFHENPRIHETLVHSTEEMRLQGHVKGLHQSLQKDAMGIDISIPFLLQHAIDYLILRVRATLAHARVYIQQHARRFIFCQARKNTNKIMSETLATMTLP